MEQEDLHYQQQQQQEQVGIDGCGKGTWIVARTDCRMAYGFDEVIERCLRFEELGAEVIYAENLQSVEEYQQLRDRFGFTYSHNDCSSAGITQ